MFECAVFGPTFPQVSQRLELILYVHSLASGVKLTVAQLRGLWGILQSPTERELCLDFLQKGASTPKVPVEHLYTAFGEQVK